MPSSAVRNGAGSVRGTFNQPDVNGTREAIDNTGDDFSSGYPRARSPARGRGRNIDEPCVPCAFARQPRNDDVILAIVAERPSRYRCTDQTAFGDLARVRASHFPASLNADS
jgi:hypothetical protein